jgi:hypothetical protein
MMLVTALGGVSRMITNVTSESAELTSVVAKLAGLLNYTESSFGSTDLSTLSTVSNWTQISDVTTAHNYLILTDTDHLTNDLPLSSETYAEFYDTLVNWTTEYLLEHNTSFIGQLINGSSPVSTSDLEEDLSNSTDYPLNMINPDAIQYFDMTHNISVSSMKNTTFDIFDMDFDPNSRNFSTEQNIDNMSDTFIDNFLSTDRLPPSNSATMTNLNFGDNIHSTSPRESDIEQLMSTFITTLTSLVAQNKDFSNSSEQVKQVSQILQRVTTHVTDPTRCHSTQCNTVPIDATASTWGPAVTFSTVTGKVSPVSVATESTLTLGKSYGKYNSNVIKILLTFQLRRINSVKGISKMIVSNSTGPSFFFLKMTLTWSINFLPCM